MRLFFMDLWLLIMIENCSDWGSGLGSVISSFLFGL